MDFSPTPGELELRRLVRTALADPAVRTALDAVLGSRQPDPDPRPLYRELGRHGVLAPHWPAEYGGLGTTAAEAAAAVAELTAAGVPDMPHVLSVQIVGAFLLTAGTPAQKSRYLPPLAAGTSLANVLYSEPDVGSDLASLSCTATPDGGGYRLDGVKVYGIGSARCEFGLCAGRTRVSDNRYDGITLFLVPLDAPGVHRGNLPSLADAPFDRVEFDGARVPAENVIGQVDGAWPLIVQCLAMERTGLDYALRAQLWYRATLNGIPADSRPDDVTLAELGRYGASSDAAMLMSLAVLDPAPSAANERAADTAAAKFFTSEAAQQIGAWAATVHGYGYRMRGLSDRDASALESAYREAPGLTLAAGTSEIMLSIVADSVRRTVPRQEQPTWT